jgi:hypothetical protein
LFKNKDSIVLLKWSIARCRCCRELGMRCFGSVDAVFGKQLCGWELLYAMSSRTASTSYDAMHGCEAADCKVVFISNSVLEALEGGSIHVHRLWNWAGSMGVSPEGGTAFEGLETEKQQLWAADDEKAGRLANRYGCPLVRWYCLEAWRCSPRWQRYAMKSLSKASSVSRCDRDTCFL